MTLAISDNSPIKLSEPSTDFDKLENFWQASQGTIISIVYDCSLNKLLNFLYSHSVKMINPITHKTVLLSNQTGDRIMEMMMDQNHIFDQIDLSQCNDHREICSFQQDYNVVLVDNLRQIVDQSSPSNNTYSTLLKSRSSFDLLCEWKNLVLDGLPLDDRNAVMMGNEIRESPILVDLIKCDTVLHRKTYKDFDFNMYSTRILNMLNSILYIRHIDDKLQVELIKASNFSEISNKQLTFLLYLL